MFKKREPRDSLRILLAEDNHCDQDLMIRLLKYMGLHADVTGNGLEVLDALKIRSYDVILMDIQMPEMDGLETSQTKEKITFYRHPGREVTASMMCEVEAL